MFKEIKVHLRKRLYNNIQQFIGGKENKKKKKQFECLMLNFLMIPTFQ